MSSGPSLRISIRTLRSCPLLSLSTSVCVPTSFSVGRLMKLPAVPSGAPRSPRRHVSVPPGGGGGQKRASFQVGGGARDVHHILEDPAVFVPELDFGGDLRRAGSLAEDKSDPWQCGLAIIGLLQE